jgi:hypothetical protein
MASPSCKAVAARIEALIGRVWNPRKFVVNKVGGRAGGRQEEGAGGIMWEMSDAHSHI